MGKGDQLVGAYDDGGHKTNEEHDSAQKAENMHRLAPETAQEPKGQQV